MTVTNEDAKAKVNQEIKPFSVIKDNITEQYNNMSAPDSSTDLNTQLESL
jgi:hypothetical protein